ncbi:MAG: ABC transporter ATP-binding protein [Myxococcota bacterium]
MIDPLLNIDELRVFFHTTEGVVRAVDGVSLQIEPGKTLGLVGESGSGKSVTALSVMQLLPANTARIHDGTIEFGGKAILDMAPAELQALRGVDVAMIFQEPSTSLNPVYRVGDQVMETIRTHEKVSRHEARERVLQLFREVNIPDPETRIDSYPHQMSGGQKQRVMIAMALACNPKLLIADEPTTALDVTTQAQILDLLRTLRDSRDMSILFITHDLGVIAEIADHVAVMFKGHLVEYGDTRSIFDNPQHPYTRSLLACRPTLDTKFRRLPTTQMFMDWRFEGEGNLVIEAKTVSRAELDAMKADAPPKQVDADERPLLRVQDLKVHFPVRRATLAGRRQWVRAVDGISFDVYRGQTLGLVGESGCGKTTTGRAILRLIDRSAGVHIEGTTFYDGIDLQQVPPQPLRALRQRMQIIFQDPYSSLNPRMTVSAAIQEPMAIHKLFANASERLDRAVSLLEEVGLHASHLDRYPHEFSGGQRQRICIARALAVEPEFIVCDESVSALDVSVQAQVLNLLKELQERRHLTYIFISHDLSVVMSISDTLAVMKDGKIVEQGPADDIYRHPEDPYTQRLIAAVPKGDTTKIRSAGHSIQ